LQAILLITLFVFLPYLLVVVFQPELRKWFTGLGKGIKIQEIETEEDYRNIVEEIVKSVNTMSLNKIGALIVIEREVLLRSTLKQGLKLVQK